MKIAGKLSIQTISSFVTTELHQHKSQEIWVSKQFFPRYQCYIDDNVQKNKLLKIFLRFAVDLFETSSHFC